MQIKFNEDDPEKYCNYCKNKIYIGQKYAVIKEDIVGGEIIRKEYHINDICTPTDDDLDEDIWISPEE